MPGAHGTHAGRIHWIARRARTALALVAALTVLATLRLVDFRSGRIRLAVDTSLQSIEISTNARDEDERLRRRFGIRDSVLIVLRGEDVFQPDTLRRIDRISRAAALIDGVVAVDSLTATALAYRTEAGLRYARIRSADLADTDAIARLRAAALATPLVRDQLVAADAHATSVVASLDPRIEDDLARDAISVRLRTLAAAERAEDVEIYVTGGPVVESALREAVLRQARSLVPAIALVLTGLLALAFRSVRGVVLPLATIAIALVWTGATASVLGYSLNLVTALAPPLLVTMGLAYCAHVLSEFEGLLREPGDRDPLALRVRLLEHVGGPLIVTGLTTVAGLLALLVNEQHQVRAFATIAAIGVGYLMLLVLVFVPAALAFADLDTARKPLPGRAFFDAAAARIGSFDRERRRTVLACAAVAFAVALLFSTRIEVGDAVVGAFVPGSRVRSDYEAVNAAMGGVTPLEVVLEGAADAWTDPPLLGALDELTEWIRAQPEVGAAVGLADHVRLLAQHLANSEGMGLPASQEIVRELLFFGEGESLRTVVDADRASTRIAVRLQVDDTASIERFLVRLRTEMTGLPKGITARVGGDAARLVESVATITRGQLQSVALALALVLAALCLQFMSVRVGVLTSLPTLLQTALYFGALGLGGIRLNATTSLVECLVLGLAVDDTIHYLARFSAAGRRYGSEPEAAVAALRAVLHPVTLTKGILAIGFLMLVTGELQNQVVFGWLAAFTLACSWLVDVFVTPAFVSKLRITTLWDMLRLDLGKNVAGTIPLFAGLSNRQARTFALMSNLDTLPAGAKLFREGDPAGDVYVVIDGELRIWIQRDGHDVELARAGRGAVIGEGGYFGRQRNANIDAMTNVRLLRFDDADQERICRTQPAIAARVFLALNRLQAERQVERLSAQFRSDATAASRF